MGPVLVNEINIPGNVKASFEKIARQIYLDTENINKLLNFLLNAPSAGCLHVVSKINTNSKTEMIYIFIPLTRTLHLV